MRFDLNDLRNKLAKVGADAITFCHEGGTQTVALNVDALMPVIEAALLAPSPCGVEGHKRCDWVIPDDGILIDDPRSPDGKSLTEGSDPYCTRCCNEEDEALFHEMESFIRNHYQRAPKSVTSAKVLLEHAFTICRRGTSALERVRKLARAEALEEAAAFVPGVGSVGYPMAQHIREKLIPTEAQGAPPKPMPLIRCHDCHGLLVYRQTDEGYEVFHDCKNGAATAEVIESCVSERTKQLEAEMEGLLLKLDALSPHGQCGCVYDHKDDLCMHRGDESSSISWSFGKGYPPGRR